MIHDLTIEGQLHKVELDRRIYGTSVAYIETDGADAGRLVCAHLVAAKIEFIHRGLLIFNAKSVMNTDQLMTYREAKELGIGVLRYEPDEELPVSGPVPGHPDPTFTFYDLYYTLGVTPKPDGTPHQQGDIFCWNAMNALCKRRVLRKRPDQVANTTLFPFRQDGTFVHPVIPPLPTNPGSGERMFQSIPDPTAESGDSHGEAETEEASRLAGAPASMAVNPEMKMPDQIAYCRTPFKFFSLSAWLALATRIGKGGWSDHAGRICTYKGRTVTLEATVKDGVKEPMPYTDWLEHRLAKGQQIKKEVAKRTLTDAEIAEHIGKDYDKGSLGWLPVRRLTTKWFGRVAIAAEKLFCYELIALTEHEPQPWCWLPPKPY